MILQYLAFSLFPAFFQVFLLIQINELHHKKHILFDFQIIFRNI